MERGKKTFLNFVMLSIIIPTLNEQENLPLLLKSIKKQEFNDYEIIVADAGSGDNTISIAKENKCKIVKGGLPGKGRNAGAKVARGDMFLFLDADVVLRPDFISKALRETKKKKLDIATFPILMIDTKLDKIVSHTYNFWAKLTERVLPHAPGCCILVKRKVHEAINGFDESIKLGEDHYYARQANKIFRYGYLNVGPVVTSGRRHLHDGRIISVIKYILAEIYMVFFGPIVTEKFNYELNHYSKKPKRKKILNKILKIKIRIEE